MADHLTELPLFPLHATLFPLAHIQLHVFEPRYREMIAHCEAFDSPFGIVLIQSGTDIDAQPVLFDVGTTARIQKIHPHDDGRMHIVAMGEQRFRIKSIQNELPYLIGIVEPVVERLVEEEISRTDALMRRATEGFNTLVRSLLSRPDFNVDIQLPEEGTSLSFVIANFLDLDNPTKQKLLEMTSTNDRLALLIPMIERQLLELKSPVLQRLTAADLKDMFTPN